MKYKTYTPEEIEEMFVELVTFEGHRLDFEKLSQFVKLQEKAASFIQQSEDVKRVEYEKPNPKQRNAMVFVDFSSITLFDEADRELLVSLLTLSDDMCISSTDETCRFSFGVKDIWTNEEER